jgi:glycoprotease/Kae1 family metallohydrolase
VPLIGVNHCIAHIEVERWKTDLVDPIVLYVSGANSQVLSYRQKRYRILGETLDIGIGNCLDKFARSAGLAHPGGPKVERLAKGSHRYLPMPYVVKGMDFSFSGIVTAAQNALNSATIEDICYSFQETAFAMLVEVCERALSQTDKSDLLLAGGVGANKRLQEMLAIMSAERGARFFSPRPEYLQDNGTMIAYTGLLMLSHGIQTPIASSAANPNFRPDEVEIVWIED